MTKQKSAAVVIALVLVLGNLYCAYQFREERKESARLAASLAATEAKRPVFAFNRMFIDKVIRGDGALDLTAMVELENAAQAVGDPEIFAQWRKVVDASDEAEAQTEAETLLGLLAQRMSD